MLAPSKVTPYGSAPPEGNVPNTVPSLARSLVTVPSFQLAVQMLAPSKAIPMGSLPTGNVVNTVLALYHRSRASLSGFAGAAVAGGMESPEVCAHRGASDTADNKRKRRGADIFTLLIRFMAGNPLKTRQKRCSSCPRFGKLSKEI